MPARGLMAGGNLSKRRGLLRALFGGIRAARAERTAAGYIQRAGHIALQHNAGTRAKPKATRKKKEPADEAGK